jgi:hydroxymethylglutaryl-CoA reductase (NADPH)
MIFRLGYRYYNGSLIFFSTMSLFQPPKLYGTDTSNIDTTVFATEPNFLASAGRNAENIIGSMTVPLGVVGAIAVNGDYASGEYIVPMATTEACLIASTNRGIKCLRQSQSTQVVSQRIGISRSPVLKVKKIRSKDWYNEQIKTNQPLISKIIASQSRHLKLLHWEIQTIEKQNEVFVCFYFDSADAMGMNMATIASRNIATEFLEPNFDGSLIAVSSNWCSDKKPAQKHVTKGRGYHVTAQANISQDVIESLLHCSVDSLMQVYESKIIRGSDLAGSLSHNAHHANVVAAIFLATGQDLAHVVEGSHGSTKIQRIDNAITISVTLPSLVCGTIGGGTKIIRQQAALHQVLQLKNKAGNGDQAQELAEVIAMTVLAGELSLLGAIAAKNLASSHDAFR